MPSKLSGSAQDRTEEGRASQDRADTVSQLFREHNRVLIGFLAARLQNEHEAQEVAQEAYVKLLQLDDATAVSFLRAYLFRVAENLALDRLRHRTHVARHIRSKLVNDSLSCSSVEDEAVACQEISMLQAVLAELPLKCQQTFRMHRLEGRPADEIAALIGISERMVRKYIARALIYTRLRLDGLSTAQATLRLKL